MGIIHNSFSTSLLSSTASQDCIERKEAGRGQQWARIGSKRQKSCYDPNSVWLEKAVMYGAGGIKMQGPMETVWNRSGKGQE